MTATTAAPVLLRRTVATALITGDLLVLTNALGEGALTYEILAVIRNSDETVTLRFSGNRFLDFNNTDEVKIVKH